MHLRWRIVVAALAFLSAVSAQAKGSADLIVVAGGGLVKPVEITDPGSLKSFDPWMGQFADWKEDAVPEAPCYRRSYEVSFYRKSPERKSALDRGNMKLIYSTRYCFDGAQGYVYLPAPDEAPRVNMSTIIREGRDGRWSHSTPAWDSLLRNALALKQQPEQVDMLQISGGKLQQSLQITDASSLRNFEPWTAQFLDWERPPIPVICGWEYDVLFFRRGVEKKSAYDQPGFNMVYGLRYCEDKNGGPGFIQLAGRNDRFGPENAANVWDARHAGRWYLASPEWSSFLRTAVQSHAR